MIGLDTNVLVRHFANDDPTQSSLASALLSSLSVAEPGFISIVTLVELVWVLQSVYGRTKSETVSILIGLLQSPELKLQHASIVNDALGDYLRTKCEFEDSLIAQLGVREGCTYTLTFDRRAAKQLGMRLLR